MQIRGKHFENEWFRRLGAHAKGLSLQRWFVFDEALEGEEAELEEPLGVWVQEEQAFCEAVEMMQMRGGGGEDELEDEVQEAEGEEAEGEAEGGVEEAEGEVTQGALKNDASIENLQFGLAKFWSSDTRGAQELVLASPPSPKKRKRCSHTGKYKAALLEEEVFDADVLEVDALAEKALGIAELKDELRIDRGH